MTNYEDVSDLTRAPILSESEERRLVRQAQRGDLAARDRLVESNIRLVISLAKPYSTSGIPFADLIQEGSIGLMTALEKFDPTRGYRFMTYAGQWVRQALSRAVDNKSKFIRLPSFVHEYVRKINKARAEFLQDCGVEPDVDELAARLGWPEKKLRKVLSQLGETVSLEDRVGDTTLGALLEDPSITPESQLMLSAASCEVSALMCTLNAAEQGVLNVRLAGATQEEAHKVAGVSRERVKTLEASALHKLADTARTRLLESLFNA
jgi:RNA polymerase primary sigma factor